MSMGWTAPSTTHTHKYTHAHTHCPFYTRGDYGCFSVYSFSTQTANRVLRDWVSCTTELFAASIHQTRSFKQRSRLGWNELLTLEWIYQVRTCWACSQRNSLIDSCSYGLLPPTRVFHRHSSCVLSSLPPFHLPAISNPTVRSGLVYCLCRIYFMVFIWLLYNISLDSGILNSFTRIAEMHCFSNSPITSVTCWPFFIVATSPGLYSTRF